MIFKFQEYDFDLYYTLGEKNVANTMTKTLIVNHQEKGKQ